MSAAASIVKRRLRFVEHDGIPEAMDDERATSGGPAKPPEKPTREDRLAAKLRENLRRRKTQARALSANAQDDFPDSE
ncbi:hypothetical protein [Novosphingobium sp. BL-52-GroH]|uniref:hypothetical protein n=1 Tax=Novosphingobium sp. BL-52-GroH TaxID=3349877 RepID=UPI00384AA00F